MNAQQEVRVATGTVLAVKQNTPERFGIKVGETTDGKSAWYDGFGKLPVEQGNVVEVAYVENGRFKNIRAVRIVSVPPKLSEPVPGEIRAFDRNRAIVYAVALKAAAACWPSASGISSDGVKKLAENFAEWLLEKSSVAEPAEGEKGNNPSSPNNERVMTW